jgi:hypothetical protein
VRDPSKIRALRSTNSRALVLCVDVCPNAPAVIKSTARIPQALAMRALCLVKSWLAEKEGAAGPSVIDVSRIRFCIWFTLRDENAASWECSKVSYGS